MASSGTFADSTGDLRLEIDWSIVSTDVSKNQSVVEAKVYMRTRWAIYWSATRTGSVTVNGTSRTYSHGNVSTVNYERKLMATEQFTVSHNTDGSKSVAMSATFPINFTYNGNYYTNITISGTAVLDVIPRTTTMSAASFSSNLSPSNTRTLNLTLSINSTSFRHDVILRDGTHEIKKLTNQSSPTSVSLTTTDVNNIISRMSTVTTKNFTVEVITKTTSNGTVIGTASRSVRATLNNSTTSPTISSRSATVRGSGYDSSISQFVRTISRANVSFTANAGYGASISSMSASINNGGTLSGSRSGSTWTGTTGTFQNSGTYTVTLSVTNSRNQTLTSTQTIPISVLAYSPPTVSDFSATRAASGTGITLSRRTTFSNTTGLSNARSIHIYSKRTTATSWGTAITTVALHNTANGTLVTSPASGTRTLSYNFRIVVTDRFGQTATSETTVSTEAVLMSFNKDIGVGMGKMHERGILDVEGDIYSNGNIYIPSTANSSSHRLSNSAAGHLDIGAGTSLDTYIRGRRVFLNSSDVRIWDPVDGGTTYRIVDSGSNERGQWLKFYDGTQICWGTDMAELTASSTTGALYRSGSYLLYYAESFVGDAPALYVNSRLGNYGWMTTGSVTLSASFVYLLSSVANSSGHVNYFAIGRWK